jgi:hypothetical protein
VGVAEREIEHLLARGYLGYRFALAASSALRLLSRPDELAHPVRSWVGWAIDAGSAVAEARITRAKRSVRVPTIAAIEGLSGVAMGLIAISSVSEYGWERGAIWSCGSNDWRAAGASITSISPIARMAGLAAQSIPYLVSGQRPRRRELRRQMVPELLTFAVEGMFLADSLRWRARQIDARAAELAVEHTRLAVTLEETSLRADVLASTIATLTTVRELLSTNPTRARRLAAAEERRLRSWLAANAALLTAPLEVDTEAAEAGSEEHMRQVARLVESAMRLAATVLTLARLAGIPTATARSRFTTLAVAGRGMASIALLSNAVSPRARQRVLAAADLIAVSAAEMLQTELRRTGEPTGWLQAYSVGCAATAGTLDGHPTIGRLTAAGLAAVSASARLLEGGSRLGRRTAAADELISSGSASIVGRWLITTTVAQSRALTATSTALAMERSRFGLEARRLRRQAFVHDGAVQVLLWVGKDDLDDDQLRDWIDQELARLEAVAQGDGDTLVSTLSSSLPRAVSDLVDGFRHLGMHIDLSIGSTPALRPDVGLTIVEILNEALTNVFKHTTARSAQCEITTVGDALVARVTDHDPPPKPVEPGSGMGTRMMMGLAGLIGGRLDWQTGDGGGTKVTLTLPLDDRSGRHERPEQVS